MLLLTGATGSIGSRLLPLLSKRARTSAAWSASRGGWAIAGSTCRSRSATSARCRTPTWCARRCAGSTRSIHLAATIRDQPPHRIEELNGLATVRLLRAAERSGVRRFVFFSALDASAAQRTRFFRAKWLAEQAVASSPLESIVFAPSIVYDRSDPWITLLRRFSFLPVLPVSGDGKARFQPIWAADAARCVVAALRRRRRATATSSPGRRRSATTRCPTWSAAPPAAPAPWSTFPCRWSAPASRAAAPFSASPCLQPGRRRS